MYNPFEHNLDATSNDVRLIDKALKGNRQALEELIRRHQAWIYNVAFRMVASPADAEDITQEILLKVITKLFTYDHRKASFRTWLYRIMTNHVINMRKRGYEKGIISFQNYFSAIEKIPDERVDSIAGGEVMVEETMTACVAGMLLCLNRMQRIVFILGVVFDAADSQGSEILEISKANFRKILSSTRAKLYNFMNEKCGVVNKNNPCRCRNKLAGFIREGWLNPNQAIFYQGKMIKVKDIIREKRDNFTKNYFSEYLELFRNHPFYDPPDVTDWLRNTLRKDKFEELFHLN